MDITAFNYGDEHVEEKARDCQRTPMQWTNQAPNAGFTSTKPFLPLSDTWHELNVENQEKASRSHLKLFTQLVKRELYAFLRWFDQTIYLIVINMTKKDHDPITIDFSQLLQCQEKDLFGEVITRSCNVLDQSSIGQEGNQVNLQNLTLQSSEAVLFRLLKSP